MWGSNSLEKAQMLRKVEKKRRQSAVRWLDSVVMSAPLEDLKRLGTEHYRENLCDL